MMRDALAVGAAEVDGVTGLTSGDRDIWWYDEVLRSLLFMPRYYYGVNGVID